MIKKPIATVRRSKKVELVKYLPDTDSKVWVPAKAVSEAAALLTGLKPGYKVLVELEVMEKPDSSCVSAYVSIKDGPSRQTFPGVIFKINVVDSVCPF